MTAPGYELRELGPDDRAQATALGRLAFGGDPAAAVAPEPPGARSWGVLGGGRLLAQATCRSYTQWWGGRRVAMGGVADVAVHPDARGQGLAARLARTLLTEMRTDGQPVSALFPTAPAIYRPLGWEVVGALEETPLATAELRRAGGPGAPPAAVRSATPADLPDLARLWEWSGGATDGLLARDGPSFPDGLAPLLSRDVVTVAEQDGALVGAVAYDRGSGYGAGAQLRVVAFVAQTAAAQAALLRSLGSWDSVASTVRWPGPRGDLALQLRTRLPLPTRSRPWMLRITDAPAAIAARGFRAGVAVQATFTLVDPGVPEHEGPWRFTVQDGAGRLERAAPGAPRLDVRGLALLYAGVDPGRLVRAGLLEEPLPGLAALVGPEPVLLDYF